MGRNRSRLAAAPVDAIVGSAHEAIGSEIDAVLAGHRAMRMSVEQMLAAGAATPAMMREWAALERSLAALSAEQRQRDRYDREADLRLSGADLDAIVLEYLREIPRERRAAVRAQLDELAPDKHLLAH